MLEKIENFYLTFFRYSLVVIATIAIVLGSINLFSSLIKIIDQPSTEKVSAPTWNELKYDVLPIRRPIEKLPDRKINNSQNSLDSDSELEKAIDPRVIESYQNIRVLFLEDFRDDFLIGLGITLQDFSEDIDNLSPSYFYIDSFLDGLVVFTKDLSLEKRLSQVSNANNRYELINESLRLYAILFEQKIGAVNDKNLTSEYLSREKNEKGYIQIIQSGYAVILFIFILLILLAFKIEADLRKLSEKSPKGS